jgi:molybdopterin/thiamine biosynthesis adenylyltransferase/ribosomal protein L37AE/L43A
MSPLFEIPVDDRYQRHRLIEGWDQDRLFRSRILVAGAGAIGNEVLKNLALLGVGEVLVVDFDRVELSNLTRSALFTEGDVGRPKAQVAAEAAKRLNPDVRAEWLDGDLEYDLGLGAVRGCDAAIACLDSLYARLVLNRACSLGGIPLVHAGISASAAEVAVFDARSGACFECGTGAAAARDVARRFSCTGYRNAIPEKRVPTTAITASLAGSLAVSELLALLHHEEGGCLPGLGPGRRAYLSLETMEIQRVEMERNTSCRWHEPATVTATVSHGRRLTVLEVLKVLDAETVLLHHEMLASLQCPTCGNREEVMRPVRRCAAGVETCPSCGKEREAERFFTVDASSQFASATLESLGIPADALVEFVRSGERSWAHLS